MEIRTLIYPTECRFYCDKCAVFLDNGQEKDDHFKYLPKEEFDKIQDHIIDDSVLNVMTMDQILSILGSLGDMGECIEFFMQQKEATDPTVKFFGEMIPNGPAMRFLTPEAPTTQRVEYLHQCNNPSCKYELMLPRDYPFTDQAVGRLVRNPEELQHPDNVIKNVMKKHVGSTIMPNTVEEKPVVCAKQKSAVKKKKKPTAKSKTTKKRNVAKSKRNAK